MFKYFRKKHFKKNLDELIQSEYNLAIRHALNIRKLCFEFCDNEEFINVLPCAAFGVICASARIFLHLEIGHTASWLRKFQKEAESVSVTLPAAVLANKSEEFIVEAFYTLEDYPINALHSFANIALQAMFAKQTPDSHAILASLITSFLTDYAKFFPNSPK